MSAGNNEVYWITARNGQIPPNAIELGVERSGQYIYAARANYENGLHIGHVSLNSGGMSLGYGGRHVVLQEYEVLCGNASKIMWLEPRKNPGNSGIVPPSNILEAGFEADGKKLYIAKAVHNGNAQIVGKCGGHLSNGIEYGYEGQSHSRDKYFCLVYA
ncbi:hypothetical protein BB558_002994 [Smittium angustum]|uniref:Uncharacterized protein n=1 Tax=Smittium angustum TaxID=133377 RepID=A0A2U1J7A4_SMIAN|nr:hypothetical protein BB558_002994 [Smittium angustum]